jgi:hypothetical protein
LNNGIVNDRPITHISKIRTEIEAIKISPDDGFECSLESYDICLARKRQSLNITCTLPFEESSQNETCSSFEHGMDTIREILAIREKCQQMCLQVNIRYYQEPEHYMLSLIRPKVIKEFSFEDFGYHYEIPKDVRLLTNKHDYTTPVALGYFGSIAGIFTGVSILSFFILFTDTEYMNSSIRKGILLIVQGGFSINLAGVFIVLFSKFLQFPLSNTVDFIQTKIGFSISVCGKPYTYGTQSFFDGITMRKTDRLSSITFWQNWRNMSTMIDSILIKNGSREVHLKMNDNAIDAQFFIVPIDNNSMAVCNIIDLAPYGMVEILDMSYKTDIEIYMHRNGQFFYEWNRKENRITVSSYRNVIPHRNRDLITVKDFTAYIKADSKSSLIQ